MLGRLPQSKNCSLSLVSRADKRLHSVKGALVHVLSRIFTSSRHAFANRLQQSNIHARQTRVCTEDSSTCSLIFTHSRRPLAANRLLESDVHEQQELHCHGLLKH
jgi:hypothetical protein